MTNPKNYLLTESLIGSVSIYMILKRLMTEFTEWDAFKLGIIDKNGNKLKSPVNSREREAWDILTRFCWNLKKITMKFIGKSKFVSYFTAAYLLKDSINLFYINRNIEYLNETLLSDITYSKQLNLHTFMKKLPIVEKLTEDNVELLMFKYMSIIEKCLVDNPAIRLIFEDEGGGDAPVGDAPVAFKGTVAADIAQHGQYLGKKTKKVKKKRKKRGKSKFTINKYGTPIH
jgi:hypothetical protein